MPIEYQIDSERRLLRARASGNVTLSEILAVLARIYADPRFERGFDQLCDFGDADLTLGDLSSTEFTETVAAAGFRDAERIAGGRLALVADKPHLYGLLRMYATISDEIPLEMRVFWTRREAEVWLSRPGETPC